MFLGTALYHGNDAMIQMILKFKEDIQVYRGEFLEEIYRSKCRETSRKNEDYEDVASQIGEQYFSLLVKYNL